MEPDKVRHSLTRLEPNSKTKGEDTCFILTAYHSVHHKLPVLMQLSMGTLNSPSSRVVKDSTPSRRRILRCINFGIGESSPNLFLNMHGEYLPRTIWGMVNLERTDVSLFYYFLYLKVNLDLEKQISLVNLHPTLFSQRWILTQLLQKKGERMVNLDLQFCWKGEQRWSFEVVWLSCPLTHA